MTSRVAFFARLRKHAQQTDPLALITPDGEWRYSQLLSAVEKQAELLREQKIRVLATALDNTVQAVVLDLAALFLNIVHVPLPLFFSTKQLRHALHTTAADLFIAPPPVVNAVGDTSSTQCADLITRSADCAKITFTSGSTGTPKGVCLSAEALCTVARGVADATLDLNIARHISALPYAILLENIAGLYAPLWRGASCVVYPLSTVGLLGSSQFDPARLDPMVRTHEAQSVIVLPQMLQAWTNLLLHHGTHATSHLKLVAVGGAAVGARTLAQARSVGLPAYEGYGLSEGASVQTLNLPCADRPGSVGRPLPHSRVRIAESGEIEIGGTLFNGYLYGNAPASCWWPTGDLGVIDEEGFLYVHGRKKNILITSYGRNVCPEWVETILKSEPAIQQAVVLGNNQPTLSAVLWPAPGVSSNSLTAAMQTANESLPDYARIAHWVIADQDFSVENGFATANSRPRREHIATYYQSLLEFI